MDIMHLPRDVAKALLIDSALSWDTEAIKSGVSVEQGYGVVPVRIEDVLQSKDDEIKFYISGKVSNYETYTEGIPVPRDTNGCQPYAARAVMTYCPACNRRQGVDYTNTELALAMGRFKQSKSGDGLVKTTIAPLKDKYINAPNDYIPYEKAVRVYTRKWDNVKIKSEQFNGGGAKKVYDNAGLWGISIKKNERLDDNSGENLSFGLVVTLKAFDKLSRINDFIQQNIRRGWIVRSVKIQEKIEINNQAQSQIQFE
jgi:hypothetical protein